MSLFTLAKYPLIVHLGLPKCASTHFQLHIFPYLKDIYYLSKASASGNDRPQYRDLLLYLRDGKPLTNNCLKTYLRLDRKLLISDENISMCAHSIWSHKSSPSPTEFLERLYMLALGCPKSMIGVLLITRDIGSWLCSRYAQSSITMVNACQDDFVARLYDLANFPVLPNQLKWFNSLYIKEIAMKYRSKVNVLKLNQKLLPQTIDEFEYIFDPMGLEFKKDQSMKKILASKYVNKLSIGSDTWRCHNGKKISLVDERCKHPISLLQNRISNLSH